MSIEDLITKGEWAIDLNWGLSQLSQYQQQIKLVSSGVPYSELGISKAREESKLVSIISEFSNSEINVSDVESLRKIEPNSIARLSLDGTMRVSDGLCSRGIQSMCNDLEVLDGIKNIDAVIIEANTGGGESSSGYMLKSAIEEFSKPVVVLAHFLGSAGVLGTVTADERIASSNGAKIGSIGSYFSLDKSSIEWYKENIDDIYSTVSPEKNKDFRDYLKGDASGFQEAATDSAKMFISEVKKNLNLNKELSKETLKGGMFYASDAKKRGLVDSIGGRKYAIKRARALSK